MCKEFDIRNLPIWLIEMIRSEATVYQLTELFILYTEEKTMKKYYKLLCKELIEKNKILSEQILKQKSLGTTSNYNIKS